MAPATDVSAVDCDAKYQPAGASNRRAVSSNGDVLACGGPSAIAENAMQAGSIRAVASVNQAQPLRASGYVRDTQNAQPE